MSALQNVKQPEGKVVEPFANMKSGAAMTAPLIMAVTPQVCKLYANCTHMIGGQGTPASFHCKENYSNNYLHFLC